MTTHPATDGLVAAAAALGPDIRASAEASERARRLDHDIFVKLRDARLFDALLPEDFGGAGGDVITMMRVVEEVSTHDGAAGWCVGIGIGTSVMAGFFRDDIARSIFQPGVVTGGPVAPMGRATPVDGGFRVNGRWPFASGVHHCGWLIAGTLVQEGDATRVLAPGVPEWRVIVFPASDARIVDTWTVSGLRGTGSHDITLRDIFVPEERTMVFLGTRPVHAATLYRFPVTCLLALSIAPVTLGLARRAIDELLALASVKTPVGGRSKLAERGVVQDAIARAEAELRAGRAYVYQAAQELWDSVAAGAKPTLAHRANVRLAAAHATVAATRAVDAAYHAGGGTSLYETSPLQRCFRDVHAATQHIMLTAANFEAVGQVLLGIDTRGAAL